VVNMRWQKSHHSQMNGACVELSHTLTHLRDSKNRTGPTLRADVAALVRAVQSGQLVR